MTESLRYHRERICEAMRRDDWATVARHASFLDRLITLEKIARERASVRPTITPPHEEQS